MKTLIYVTNRAHLIFSIYAISLFLAAGLFSVFESKSLWDGLWWAVVTALTIGYGDLSPATVPGRLTGIVFGHFWIFGVIPMIIANAVSNLLQDRNKFTHDEQEWLEKNVKSICEKLNIPCDEPPPSV